MSHREDLTRAQKAQITKERRKREELAYAASLEQAGKGNRTTKQKALDNAVWKGAAPMGHGSGSRPNNSGMQSQATQSGPESGRGLPMPAATSQSGSKRSNVRRRLPPSIPDSEGSDNDRLPRAKRPRVVQPAEVCDDNSTDVREATQHHDHYISTADKKEPRKRTRTARSAHQAFNDDADIHEEDEDTDQHDQHSPGEDNDGCSDYDQTQDRDLQDIDPRQLRQQLYNELPHVNAHPERSLSPEIYIPAPELEMTTSTEPDEDDVAHDSYAHVDTEDEDPHACQQQAKKSEGHRAKARRAEKPQFVDETENIQASVPMTRRRPMNAQTATTTEVDNNPNSPNYGWPVSAHYVPPPPRHPMALKSQPLPLQKVIRTAIRAAMSDFLFKNAYPSDENNWKGLRTVLRRCARRLSNNSYAERFEQDILFGVDVAHMLVARITNQRTTIKDAASTCVAGYYGLLPGDACAARVDDLVDKYRYIFPDEGGHLKRNKPFLHPCILSVISKGFFTSARGSSLAEKHAKHFTSIFEEGPKNEELELPIPVVALAATAVHCGLLEWKSGEHTKLVFTGNVYQNVYERHVKLLKDIRTEGAKYHRLMSDMYKTVSRGKCRDDTDASALIDFGAMEE